MMRRGLVKATPAVAGGTASPSDSNLRGKKTVSGKAWGIFAMNLLALTLLTSCATKSSSGSGGSGPGAVSPSNGSLQNAVVGTAFASPLVAVVTRGGVPTSGIAVTFTAPSSGASGTFSNGTATETDTSDANGLATTSTITANATSGTYSVSATISASTTPATFSLTNVAAAALAVNPSNGSLQSALITTAFQTPLVAVVTLNGAPQSNVTVTFSAPPTGASGTFSGGSATENDATDANGLATSSTFTANSTPGPYTVTASISGGASSAGFSLTNTVLTILVTGGNHQSTLVSAAFAAPLSATVVDSNTNPVSGVSVTFTAPSSGASGTFTGGATETDTTNASGVATSTTFTANATAGAFSVTATVAGAASPASFSLTNNSHTPAGLVASGGTPQRANVSMTFGTALVATVVDANSLPVSGVPVTFTAPATGASGVFSNGTDTENVTTDANGRATSSTFTANSIVGGPYTVNAASGALTPVNFILTNVQAGTVLTSYTFYLSGQEAINNTSGVNMYSLAGAFTVDQSGGITGGEQDYNDGNGLTSPQPSGDLITGGTLTIVDPATGEATLVLNTNNSALGVNGTETFGVQFVNASHALIMQWDNSATSSGSLDLQNLTTAPTGGFAFTLAGVDPGYAPIAFGGVFAFNGDLVNPLWNGTIDVNDFNAGVSTGTALTATVTAMDAYGRGQISGISVGSVPLSLNYYAVTPEALRIIDMNNTSSQNFVVIGSAFGQGANATNAANAGLGQSVFGIAGNPFSINYAALGQFTTSNTSSATANLSGVADDNQFGGGVSVLAAAITGTYQVGTNGYGTMTITANQLGGISSLGLYLTDPNLNLNDPNNSTGGGGALLLDLDTNVTPNLNLAGGTGFITPQTDTSTGSFANNYAAAWQAFNNFSCVLCEFDMVAQGSVTAGVMSLTGLISDPFQTLSTQTTPSGNTFTGTPQADSVNHGRYSMTTANSNPLVLDIVLAGVTDNFDVVLYQASGGQLFWLETDTNGVFLGPLQQQGSLAGIPLARKGAGNIRQKQPDAGERVRNRTRKPPLASR